MNPKDNGKVPFNRRPTHPREFLLLHQGHEPQMSSDSGQSDLDEKFYQMQPPPYKYEDICDKMVDIYPKGEAQISEETPQQTTCPSNSDSVVVNKRKRRKKKGSARNSAVSDEGDLKIDSSEQTTTLESNDISTLSVDFERVARLNTPVIESKVFSQRDRTTLPEQIPRNDEILINNHRASYFERLGLPGLLNSVNNNKLHEHVLDNSRPFEKSVDSIEIVHHSRENRNVSTVEPIHTVLPNEAIVQCNDPFPENSHANGPHSLGNPAPVFTVFPPTNNQPTSVSSEQNLRFNSQKRHSLRFGNASVHSLKQTVDLKPVFPISSKQKHPQPYEYGFEDNFIDEPCVSNQPTLNCAVSETTVIPCKISQTSLRLKHANSYTPSQKCSRRNENSREDSIESATSSIFTVFPKKSTNSADVPVIVSNHQEPQTQQNQSKVNPAMSGSGSSRNSSESPLLQDQETGCLQSIFECLRCFCN